MPRFNRGGGGWPAIECEHFGVRHGLSWARCIDELDGDGVLLVGLLYTDVYQRELQAKYGKLPK
jgi:hypothetical protein